MRRSTLRTRFPGSAGGRGCLPPAAEERRSLEPSVGDNRVLDPLANLSGVGAIPYDSLTSPHGRYAQSNWESMSTAIQLPSRAAEPQPRRAAWTPNGEDWMRLRLISHKADVSPLRYPGGKRKLAVLIGQIFARAGIKPRLLVEPFAGGASVSIALLEVGFVENIALSDTDELVAGFWKTVFSSRAEEFAQIVETAKVTLAERKRIIASRPRSALGLAYKCLFLNRTSFSGILHSNAGVIGGKHQRSSYKIGCRFNRKRLAQRIRALSALRHRVQFVECQDYLDTITMVAEMPRTRRSPDSVFWYFDPPFFERADRLYRKVFTDADHAAFYEWINLIPGHFVLSYDDVPASEELYGDDPRLMRLEMLYGAGAASERPTVTELIISDLTPDGGTKISINHKTRSILSANTPRTARRKLPR
jgi:DNA adenine methylase